MNDYEHTGAIVQAHADQLAHQLTGIQVITALLSDVETHREQHGELPELVSGFRVAALLNAAGALAGAAYSRLVQAVGEEP